jgi:RHS repeat-associated protein
MHVRSRGSRVSAGLHQSNCGQETANYPVPSGSPSTTTMAAGIASAINADTNLQAIGVTAASTGAVITISVNATTYTVSTSGGATETLSLGSNINGNSAASIGGTVTNSDTLIITVHNSALSGGQEPVPYTVSSSPTIPGVASGLVAAINADTNLQKLGVTSSNSNAATSGLASAQNFSGTATLAAGTNTAAVAGTNGNSLTTTNLYQVPIPSSGSQNLTYDANGNMTSDGTNSYSYDAENRLLQITYPGSGNNTTFTYDPLGRYVEMVESGSSPSFSNPATMQFIWCGGQRCEARDGSGNVLAQYFAAGETQLVSSTLVPYFYTKDHLSSVREMTNGSGTTELTQSYDPYGRVTQLQNAGGFYASFGYAGYYVHQRSGLNLTATRAYSASLGRFINRDPIGEAGGLNLYGYVDGDPIGGSDPSGTSQLATSFPWLPIICALFPSLCNPSPGPSPNPGKSCPVKNNSGPPNNGDPGDGGGGGGGGGGGLPPGTSIGAGGGPPPPDPNNKNPQPRHDLGPPFTVYYWPGRSDTPTPPRFIAGPKGITDLGPTLKRIQSGSPATGKNEGGFKNREGLLPQQPDGSYTKYNVNTPGNAARIIVGPDGSLYFTPDHYQTFIRLN